VRLNSPKRKKIWTPYFLRERTLRTYLQALYNGLIGAHDNARVLLEYDPNFIDESLVRGNKLVRACFRSAVRYLTFLKEYSISDSVFATQLLEPARCAARFKLVARSTTRLIGLIFARSSEFYDKYFQDKVSSLSLIVPDLEGVMTLRCRTDMSRDIGYGMCELEGIQPIPYVNRIHPVHLSLEEETQATRLYDLDFLKVSLQDLPRFSHSLALENFCEVESTQFGKRCLGAPCIFSGLLSSVKVPQLTLQGVSKPTAAFNFLITNQLLSHLDTDISEIESLQGKAVRILAVVWYTHGRMEANTYPEVFFIEPIEDPSEMINDELQGFVRLRGRVRADTIRLRYPNDIFIHYPRRINYRDDGWVEWAPNVTSSNKIISKFLEEKLLMNRLRQQAVACPERSLIVHSDCIIDRSKLRRNTLAQKISKNKELQKCFVALLQIKDGLGTLPSSVRELVITVPDLNQKSLYETFEWLRNMGFIVKTRRGMRLSKEGVEVLYLANRGNILECLEDTFLKSGKRFVGLGELHSITKQPLSLLVRALRELEQEGKVTCSIVNGRRCDLFWNWQWPDGIPENALQEVLKKLRNMESQILTVLGDVPHALHTLKILEELHADNLTYFEITELLSRLRSNGRLERIEDDIWWYPWEKRILDILSSNPYDMFTYDELMNKACVPITEKWNILGILRKLKQAGKVTEVVKEKWAIQSQDEGVNRERMRKILKCECKKYVFEILQKRRKVQDEWLAGMARSYVRKLMSSYGKWDINPFKLCNEVINEMLEKGEIKRINSTLIFGKACATSPSR